MKSSSINYICFALLIALFTAVVSTIPKPVKAKQTISQGIQAASTQYTDADAIDHEARAYCAVHTCTINQEEITNPLQ